MRIFFSFLISAAAFAVLSVAPSAAHAGEVALGAQAGVAVPLEDLEKPGVLIDGLLGYRVHAGPIWLQPEAMGGVRKFGNGAQDANFGATLGRVTGGARLGLGGPLQPQVFAHGGAGFGDASGFTFDAGGALDLKIWRVFVGATAGYGFLGRKSASVNWIDVGGHVGLLL